MSRIVNAYTGDYKVKVISGGNITLDTGTSTISAVDMQSGQEYTIVTVGTTDFTLYGANSNDPRTTFKATGPGLGTGTVSQPAGNVIVIGNLTVKGITNTVESTNTSIADNVIVLNEGQKGNGISAALSYKSGITIRRGSRPDAELVFDESATHYNPKIYIVTATSATDNTLTLSSTLDLTDGSEIIFRPGSGPVFGGLLDNNTNPTQKYYIKSVLPGNKITISTTQGGVIYNGLLNRSGNMSLVVTGAVGTFTFKTDTGLLTGIATNSIAIDDDLTKQTDLVFDLNNGVKKLKVVNTTDYYARVTDDNDIPNFKLLQQYVASTFSTANPTQQGTAIVDRIIKNNTLIGYNQAIVLGNKIEFDIQSQQRAFVDANGLTVDNVNLYQNTVANFTNNLILTAGNLNVEIDGILNLQDQVNDPTQIAGYTKLYSKSQLTSLKDTPGRTGIFFRNAVNNQDELVSKNRALLFSILF